MKIKFILICCIASLLFGCAATQNISNFTDTKPSKICIVKHDAVKTSFLIAMQEGFINNNIDTKIVNGEYKLKHNMYSCTIDSNEIGDCDAIAFYVANWRWDLILYMSYANIWITDIDMKKKMAQATYQASFGINKFINARKKTLQLIDQMYKVE